jgi:hypothetical protein
LQKLKGRSPLRIDGDQFTIENEVAPSEASAWTTLEKRLLSTFLWRENSVTSRPRFTAMQR